MADSFLAAKSLLPVIYWTHRGLQVEIGNLAISLLSLFIEKRLCVGLQIGHKIWLELDPICE
jgi:hypothetical protein